LLDVKAASGEGCAEPEVAITQLDELSIRGFDRRSVGVNKGYHTKHFVADCPQKGTAPHVARISGRKNPGLGWPSCKKQGIQKSQKLRKRVEEHLGLMRPTGRMAST